MTINLRPYQQAAVDATWAFLRERTGAPVIVLPTGSGKTPVMAAMVKQAVEVWGGRVLIVSHVRELLEQIHATILRLWPDAPVGVNSAGLGQRDTAAQIIVAGIQSIFRTPTALGRRDLVFIDECDLLSPDEDTMYQQLLATLRVVNPDLRVIGLTATPFRGDSGYIYGAGRMFEAPSYEASVRTLIDQRYLCSLRGKDGGKPDLSAVHIRGGEYVAGELEAAVSDGARISAACDDIVRQGSDRIGWLVFACGVKHAGLVSEALVARGIEAPVIIGDTPTAERDEVIGRFKAKGLRCIVNVGVLTVGFDAPHCDLIALLRPTLSTRLYAQMLGRGLRISDGKSDCLVLDFAGCIAQHGPIDALRVREVARASGESADSAPAPTKVCPECQEILPAAAVLCHCCGFEFPREIARHDHKAANASPLTVFEEAWHPVALVDFCVHSKKGAPPEAPKTLRVMYTYGFRNVVSEFVCVEHTGFARGKAEQWWKEHGLPGSPPKSAKQAADILSSDRWREPVRILLRLGGQYPELIGKELGEEVCSQCAACGEKQISTPSGLSCRNGHGGAPSLEPGADASEPAWVETAPSDEVPF